MKRIFLILSVLLFSFGVFSQTVTPREGNTNGVSKVYFPTISTQYISDATSPTDTVMISPNSTENWYFINTSDTLKGCICIGLKDSTAHGRSKYFTDDNCHRGDKIFLVYTTTGLKLDTIKFYGDIYCDSLGSGNNQLLNIKKDTNKKSYTTEFIFDGTNFIERSYGSSGNGR